MLGVILLALGTAVSAAEMASLDALRAAGTGMFRTQILKAFPDSVTDPILARL